MSQPFTPSFQNAPHNHLTALNCSSYFTRDNNIPQSHTNPSPLPSSNNPAITSQQSCPSSKWMRADSQAQGITHASARSLPHASVSDRNLPFRAYLCKIRGLRPRMIVFVALAGRGCSWVEGVEESDFCVLVIAMGRGVGLVGWKGCCVKRSD